MSTIVWQTQRVTRFERVGYLDGMFYVEIACERDFQGQLIWNQCLVRECFHNFFGWLIETFKVNPKFRIIEETGRKIDQTPEHVIFQQVSTEGVKRVSLRIFSDTVAGFLVEQASNRDIRGNLCWSRPQDNLRGVFGINDVVISDFRDHLIGLFESGQIQPSIEADDLCLSSL